MDFQSRMAARRAEIVQQERQAKKVSEEAFQVQQAAEKQQREVALDKIAGDVCRDGVEVIRREEELELARPVTTPLDVEGLRRTKLESLSEARGAQDVIACRKLDGDLACRGRVVHRYPDGGFRPVVDLGRARPSGSSQQEVRRRSGCEVSRDTRADPRGDENLNLGG